ncbi:ATP binding protein [Penicillium macrosclerotiorum]|uniref:ATP binding protein n=1 Tax=Penicillium macrosclerotiorum TaxID=303699 RepID=UPI0025474808|nr:ATP binding protein [Penicillium macrosclerotiorum]KAJ5689181.1 ATP binding protein [Penicillium macrosclerotiorum]
MTPPKFIGPPRPREFSRRGHGGRGPTPQSVANRAIREYFGNYGCQKIGSNTDWLMKPELPTADEILGIDSPDNDVLLAPNVISEAWSSRDDYLKTHYNLIREDAVAPLRDAVAFLRSRPSMNDTNDVAIYEKVFINRVTFAHRGLAFRISFSTRRAGRKILWKYSSRLITGSLVALTPANDMFSTRCVVAIIAARALENLSMEPPEVDIFFVCPDDIDFDPQQEWVMVEARAGYFEAYRHTMTALQKLSKERFPLHNHICQLQARIGAPEYIGANPVMDFRGMVPKDFYGNTRFSVLGGLSSAPLGSLNIYQRAALKEIFSKKLAIIQGPPGTGKTFVSVVALKLLLAHMRPGDPPIVLATQTNHALDQLLLHLSDFESDYIRLGGRSTDLRVCNRTLFSVRKLQYQPALRGGLLEPARREISSLVTAMMKIFKPFDRERGEGALTGSIFIQYGLLTQDQIDSLEDGGQIWTHTTTGQDIDPLMVWLGDEVVKFKTNHSNESLSFTEDEIDMEYELLRELEAEQAPDSDEWEALKGSFIELGATVRGRQWNTVPENTMNRYLQTTDLWKIPAKARGAVYNELRKRLFKIAQDKLVEEVKKYNECSKKLLIGKYERDYQLLRKAKLVGMTTTGLSKYRALVSSLKPRIVMIEEAAEVIEAPVAVACFESLQHLILVGDHKQLKGRCALKDLAGKPFYLDISMFERLVQNGISFVMLREQRRMAPEIRQVLDPIYGDLHDHDSVQNYPLIQGMGDIRSFFFTHDYPEAGDSLSSKINEFEAVMVVEFFNYLLLNGASVNKVTILTFYNGQRKLLLKILKTHRYLEKQSPRVVTVDSFQGEENDIVLLSLVRSSNGHGIGFLSVDNRVCVALSRARYGMYIFGNAEHLVSGSLLWRDVVEIMTGGKNENSRVGSALPLTCRTHGNKTLVSSSDDWETINGGCAAMCEEPLPCGHQCPLQCHGFAHSWVSCYQKCLHVRPCCGLACSQICSEPHTHTCLCLESEVKDVPIAVLPQALLALPAPTESLKEEVLLIEFSDDEVTGELNSGQKEPKGKVEQKSLQSDSSAKSKLSPLAPEFSPTSQSSGGFSQSENSPRSNRHRTGTQVNCKPINTSMSSSTMQPMINSPIRKQDDSQKCDAHDKWQRFAQGGARKVDLVLENLAKTAGVNTDEVQLSMTQVDEDLIPLTLRQSDSQPKTIPTAMDSLLDLD